MELHKYEGQLNWRVKLCTLLLQYTEQTKALLSHGKMETSLRQKTSVDKRSEPLLKLREEAALTCAVTRAHVCGQRGREKGTQVTQLCRDDTSDKEKLIENCYETTIGLLVAVDKAK